MKPTRIIDEIADEFEAAWLAGQVPKVEDFVAKIDEEHRPALLAALLPLDLTYRGKLGETVDSGNVAKADKAFDVTLDSDPDGPKLLVSPATNDGARVKYFGEYELLSEIARGGMGVVYKARQVKLNRIVALKMILSAEFASQEAIRRFRSEAESAANLDHPGVVPIFEIGEHDGQHYFSMGFVEGQSLQEMLSKGPIAPREAAAICRKIAFAVHYAHARGVIHRDLKPSNILLDLDGEPRITDFGLAKSSHDDSGLTATGQVLGTPSYMPPEQAIGDIESIGPQADVYSLGAILYALLIGLPPFRATSVSETLRQVIEQEPLAPRRLNREIPIDLETLCLKAIEKDRHRRYKSAKAFGDELTRFLEGRPIEARPLQPLAKAWRWCVRNPVTAALTTALVVTMLGGTVFSTFFAIQSQKNENDAIAALETADAALVTAREQTQKATTASTKAERELAKFESAFYATRLGQAQAKVVSGDSAGAQDILRTIGSLDPTKFEHRFLWTSCINTRLRTVLKGNATSEKKELSGEQGRTIAPTGPADANLMFIPKTRHLAFSHDGMTIVTLGERGELELRSSASYDVHRSIEHGLDQVDGVAFSEDDRLLLVNSNYEMKGNVIDVATGTSRAGFESIRGLRLSFLGQQGERVVGSDNKNTTQIWSSTSGRIEVSIPSSAIIAAEPNGRWIVADALEGYEPSELSIWDSLSGKQLKTLGAPASVFPGYMTRTVGGPCHDVSPNGDLLASGYENGVIRIRSLENGDVKFDLNSNIRTPLGRDQTHGPDFSGQLFQICFSEDGKRLASLNDQGETKIWDVATGQELLSLHRGGHDPYFPASLISRYPPTSLKFDRQGRWLVCCSSAGIEKWDGSLNLRYLKLGSHSSPVLSVAHSPVDNTIVSVSWSGEICVWNPDRDQRPQVVCPPTQEPGKHFVAFSSDGKRFCVSDKKGIAIFEVSSGDELLRHSMTCDAVTFVDDNRLAILSDQEVLLCSAVDGQRVGFIEHGECRVLASHGKQIATMTGLPISFTRWDAYTGQKVHESVLEGTEIDVDLNKSGIVNVRIVHDDDVMFIGETSAVSKEAKEWAMSADSTRCLAHIRRSDARVEVWNSESGKKLCELPSVSSPYLSPTGRYVAAFIAGESQIGVWDANSGEVLYRLSAPSASGWAYISPKENQRCQQPIAMNETETRLVAAMGADIGVWDLNERLDSEAIVKDASEWIGMDIGNR